MKLFWKNSNLCDHNSPTSQTDGRTDGQTDRQTTCDRNTALCTKVHRVVKSNISATGWLVVVKFHTNIANRWLFMIEMVNGKWLPDFIERLKASAWQQLYLPLLPFTHARSESINADSLKLQLLTNNGYHSLFIKLF